MPDCSPSLASRPPTLLPVFIGRDAPALRQAVAEGANGGYFAFRFSGQPGWQGRLLERLVDWRNRLLALGFALGVTPQRLARLYAGRPRRER